MIPSHLVVFAPQQDTKTMFDMWNKNKKFFNNGGQQGLGQPTLGTLGTNMGNNSQQFKSYGAGLQQPQPPMSLNQYGIPGGEYQNTRTIPMQQQNPMAQMPTMAPQTPVQPRSPLWLGQGMGQQQSSPWERLRAARKRRMLLRRGFRGF